MVDCHVDSFSELINFHQVYWASVARSYMRLLNELQQEIFIRVGDVFHEYVLILQEITLHDSLLLVMQLGLTDNKVSLLSYN